MILKNNSKDPKSNNVKLLSVYKTEAYFYYKNVYLLKLFWLLINWEGGGGLIWYGVRFPKATMVASSIVTNRVQWK